MISSSKSNLCSLENVKFGTLIIWLWIGCIFIAEVSSQNYFYTNRFGKREQNKVVHPPLKFEPGPRFGRSDGNGGGGKSSRDIPKMFEIVPRVDRFFHGSRYGKRSSHPSIADENYILNLRRFEAALNFIDHMKQLAAVKRLEGEEENIDYDDQPQLQKEADGPTYRFPYEDRNGI